MPDGKTLLYGTDGRENIVEFDPANKRYILKALIFIAVYSDYVDFCFP